MSLSSPFIKRPVMTSLVMLALVAFGAGIYPLLPVASIPTMESPVITVTTNYPGASPEVIARTVSSPLERQFIIMEGIQVVTSANTYETSTITLQFHLDVNIDVAAQETLEAINQAQGELPDDLPQLPTYTKSNPTDTPAIYLVVHSDTVRGSDLYDYGYNLLGQQMGTIDGVADIDIYGQPYAVRVEVDPEKLAAKNITLTEVTNRINEENPDQPTGKFYGPNRSIPTITYGQVPRADGYGNLIIKYVDGDPVRVNDIGYAYDSLQNNKMQFRWVTKESTDDVIVLAIYRSLGYNTVELCNNVIAKAHELAPQLPAAIKMDIPFSLSWWILQSVDEVKMTLGIAFLLVILVIFFYLGKVRNSIIPLITLPITLTGTLILMYFCGYSIDILSLSAFTLAIGFLIDDAIVVLENIVRWIQGGEKPFDAALKGSAQISTTILSISLSLGAVFIPLLFMSGSVGDIFHEFAGVMLIAILFSGFISLTLTPMLCSRFVPPYSDQDHPWLERVSDRLNAFMLRLYNRPLKWALRHKFFILLIACSSLIFSGIILKVIPRSFLPPSDLGVAQCFAQAELGTSPERMKEFMDEITKICMASPYVDTLAFMSGTPTDAEALFFLNLVGPKERPDIWTIMDELTEKIMTHTVGVDVMMKAFPLINLQVGGQDQGRAQFQYIMQGFTTDELNHKGGEFVEYLQSQTEFMHVSSDLQANSPTYSINILRDQAHSYTNLNALDIEQALQYAYGEAYISKINDPDDMYYVIVEVAPDFLANPTGLNKLYLGNGEQQTAIRAVIDGENTTGPLTVNHINALPSITMSFDVNPDVPLSEALDKLESLADEHLPEDVIHYMAGSTADFEKSNRQLMILLAVAIFIIYLILGILYENYLHPFTALVSVPLAAIGGLLTLLVFGESLSVYAFIGLIMLMGIVMKNGIIVIDFALEEMEKGLSPLEAAYNAATIRFRPIVMTTLSAMMGAVPVALGIGGTVAKGRAPLGMVIVGGLIFSQLVTLFIIPVTYVYICQLQNFITSRTAFFRDKSESES